MATGNEHIYLDDDTLRLLQSIKAERIKRGLSQEKLAALICIPSTSLSLYERLVGYPKLSTFLKIAEFFGWDISHNVNFLFLHHKEKLHNLRAYKKKRAFSYREIQNLVFCNRTDVYEFFKGNGNIHTFAEISKLFAEEKEFTGNFYKFFRNGKKIDAQKI